MPLPLHAGRFLRARLDETLDALFPPLCRVCGATALPGALGGACARHALPAEHGGARCGRCAAALPEVLPEGALCAACRRSRPPFRRVVALGAYAAREGDDGLREWILALKHGGRRDLAPALGRALAVRLAPELGERAREAVLVPVPLHRLRCLERGYDQARLLARHAAEALGATCLAILCRRRWTPPQGAPGARSRSANVHAAFALRRPVRPGELRGRPVWLIDDVLTSGATAGACTRVLTGAGARGVGVACLARAASAPGAADEPGPPVH